MIVLLLLLPLQIRSFLFQHTLEIAEENHVLVQKDPRGAKKHAGIMVPIYEDSVTGELHVILTERSHDLSSHAGEVSFPGGKTDLGEDDLDAAVREAEEEIGLSGKCITVSYLTLSVSQVCLMTIWRFLAVFLQCFPKRDWCVVLGSL